MHLVSIYDFSLADSRDMPMIIAQIKCCNSEIRGSSYNVTYGLYEAWPAANF